MRSSGEGLQPNEGLHLTPRFARRRLRPVRYLARVVDVGSALVDLTSKMDQPRSKDGRSGNNQAIVQGAGRYP
jgi:hypothetical protein